MLPPALVNEIVVALGDRVQRIAPPS